MVKFGHELAEGVEKMGFGLSHDALNYKEFKKLLKFADRDDDGESVDAAGGVLLKEQQTEFGAVAASRLTSSFWAWPDDAQGVVATTKLEWVSQVFERKLIAEAKRLQACMLAMVENIKSKKELLGSLKEEMEGLQPGDSAEEEIRRVVDLRAARGDQEEQLRHFAILNYTGFFKILKKYDKLYRKHGLPPKMQRVMPYIDRILDPESWKSEVDADGSMQRLDEAFDHIMALLSESPEKAGRLAAMRNSQKQLCEELLCETRSRASSEDDSPNRSIAQMAQQMALGSTPPLVSAVRAAKYNLNSFMGDLTAAIIISVAGIPKAMAYAALAGVPVDAGLATLYMPCFVYALLGSSRQVAISPQSVTCLLLAQIVDDALKGGAFEDDMEERVKLSMMYTLTTGIVILLFGVMKLGFLLNFISRPVLSGFVSASALIAVASTVKSLMGLYVKKSPILYILLTRIVEKLPELHWQTSIISLGGISLMIALTLLQKRGIKKLEKREGRCIRAFVKVVKMPAVIYLVLAGIILGASLCSFTVFSPWSLNHVILGRGASFPSLFYQSVIQQTNCKLYPEGVKTQYVASGSGDGLQSVLTSNSVPVDFAGSDVKPSAGDLSKYGIQSFPVVKSLLCPAINLPLLAGSDQIRLILDMPTVADIFSGKVTSWLDPRIHKLNPNLPWHLVGDQHTISVVLRSDESGTTQAFSEALLECEGCDPAAFTAGLKVAWGAPKQVQVQGMHGMVKAIESTPWSIGYATFSDIMAADGPAVCTALAGSTGTFTALLAWTNPTLATWPLWHTSHVLVPAAESVQAPAEHPRFDSCKARMHLATFVEELYRHPSTAREFHFELLPRPQGLDALKCGSAEKQSLSEEDTGGKASKTCKKPSPKCSDVKMVGYVQPAFVTFRIPRPETEVLFSKLLVDSLLLACIALLEHVANVKLYADRGGYQYSSSADLVAVGLCNIFGCMSGSFLVAGGFSRSALNAKAVSQISLLLSVFVSVGVVFAFAPLLSLLPDAILNVILFMAVIGLVDWKLVLQLGRLGREGLVDLLALVIAFSATCFFGVVQGMASAISFSLVVFVFNSSYPQIVELGRMPGTMYYAPANRPSGGDASCVPGRTQRRHNLPIKVLRFEAPLWFANASRFLDRMLLEISHEKNPNLHGIVLDMSSVPWVDFSAGVSIKKLMGRAKEEGTCIAFAHANTKVKSMIQSLAGLDETFFFESNYDARMAIDTGTAPGSPKRRCDTSPLISATDHVDIEIIEPLSDSDDEQETETSISPQKQEIDTPIPTQLGQSHMGSTPEPSSEGKSLRERAVSTAGSCTV